LADCYYNGYGVAKDRAYAITLAQKSLELGYEAAADVLKKWCVR
jgi:TPR repeat protein